MGNAAFADAGGNLMGLKPVVKLFTPDGRGTWVLVALFENEVAYGLCDLGCGCPEVGYVSLDELRALRGWIFFSEEFENHEEKDMLSAVLNLNENNRIVRLPEVKRLTGLSESTIWRKEKAGEFPVRIKLSSRAAGWLLADINRWLQSRILHSSKG